MREGKRRLPKNVIMYFVVRSNLGMTRRDGEEVKGKSRDEMVRKFMFKN